jgi:hypothetical protein
MNNYIIAALCIIAGYFIGSILFAYIITKILTGKDIREIGNKNPGASNTMRNVGKGAGIAVTVLDILKAMVPLFLARAFFFSGDTIFDWIILFLIGMSAETFLEVIPKCAGTSWMLENRAPHIREGDYTPHSAVDIWPKDLCIVQDIADSAGMDMPLTKTALAQFRAASAAGFGGEDDAAVAKIYAKQAGVKLP